MRVFEKQRRHSHCSQSGMTMLELIISCAILLILASAAFPVARYSIYRQREAELRRDLRELRHAIDRYKDLADRNLIKVEMGSEGYPQTLDALVKGVPLSSGNGAGNGGGTGHKIRFLRKIPVDPMTGQADWGLRAVGDDPDSTTWGGKNVFDVYSSSTAIAQDGTRYSDW